jgi:hypothetical protein
MAYNSYSRSADQGESIMPAFEMVKRDLFFTWLSIKNEYNKYIKLKLNNTNYNTNEITCLLFGIYDTDLRAKFLKMKNKSDFIKMVDDMTTANKPIPQEQIRTIVREFSQALEDLGLTDIGIETEPWEMRFSKSYGDE